MARGGFPGIPGGNMQQLMRQAQNAAADDEGAGRAGRASMKARPAARFPARSAASASLPDHRQGRGRSRRGRNARGYDRRRRQRRAQEGWKPARRDVQNRRRRNGRDVFNHGRAD